MIVSAPCAAGNHDACGKVFVAHVSIAEERGNQWIAISCDCECHPETEQADVLEVGLALDVPYPILRDAVAEAEEKEMMGYVDHGPQ